MALLIDGGWSAVEDLQPYDGSATTAAAEEGIDLQAKMSLSEAWIRDEVEEFLRWEGRTQSIMGEGALKAINAVVDARLVRWHLMNVLAAMYRDASFSQSNDRYQAKYQAYTKDAAARRAEYFQHGVPYVFAPVRRPSAPLVAVVAGTQLATSYGVAVTQVDARGQESAGSPVAAVQAGDGTSITVTPQGLAEGNGWNVYVLTLDGVMRKQNDTLLDGATSWTMPAAGLIEGVALGTGQKPDGIVRQRRVLPRG